MCLMRRRARTVSQRRQRWDGIVNGETKGFTECNVFVVSAAQERCQSLQRKKRIEGTNWRLVSVQRQEERMK